MLELVLIASFHQTDTRRQTFCLDKIQCLTTVAKEMLKYQWQVFLIYSCFSMLHSIKFPCRVTHNRYVPLKYYSENLWSWRFKNNHISLVVLGCAVILSNVCQSVTMMLLNIVVVSIPSKLIISLNQQFGICYLLPSLFGYLCMHCSWFTAARESGCTAPEHLEGYTSGTAPVWGLFSLKRKLGKKIISQSPIFTI